MKINIAQPKEGQILRAHIVIKCIMQHRGYSSIINIGQIVTRFLWISVLGIHAKKTNPFCDACLVHKTIYLFRLIN